MSVNIHGIDMKRFLRYSILFLCNWLLSSCAEVKIIEEGSKKAFNIVIFFTNVDGKCSQLQQDTLKFLDLHQATRVKLSAAEIQSSFQDESKTGSEFCKDFLKDSLMSLTHFCHTVMKMKTAIASVSSKEIMNDIQEPEAPFHAPHIEFSPDSHARYSRSEESQPGWSSRERPAAKPPQREAEDLTANTKNIITGTKHTEVFQIRVRRNVVMKEQEEPAEEKRIHVKVIDDYPHERKSSHPWDVLDIMKHVRYSFLGDLFEDAKHAVSDQEDLADISQLGKEKLDPGLFSMVKSTLDNLLDPPEASFLMVIFGGHLHTIADPHSAIVQSIKYVIENADIENTLIVVTGSCSTEESGRSNHSAQTVPVYAKGPQRAALSECKLLYDIPLVMRKILELHSGAGLGFPDEAS